MKQLRIVFALMVLTISIKSVAQQFNSDNYLVMPHGTGTFVLANGERNATLINSFALIPKFEFFAQANLFWENEKEQTPNHFTTTIYGKYNFWENKNKNGGSSVFLGAGRSPSYYLQTEYVETRENFWMALPTTIPLFDNAIFLDVMPGALVNFSPKDSNREEWGFTHSTRLNIYKIIPETAVVIEFYGTEGDAHSAMEYKAGLRWEKNSYIIPAISYGAQFGGDGGAKLEVGVIIFTPPYIKSDYMKNNPL